MNTDSELAIINGILSAFDPRLSAKYNPSEDIESEDAEFEILRDGALYQHDFKGELSSWSIQCCLIGGGYAVTRHIYRDGAIYAVAFHYDGNNLRAASKNIVKALESAQ